jgi:hypothetical protein
MADPLGRGRPPGQAPNAAIEWYAKRDVWKMYVAGGSYEEIAEKYSMRPEKVRYYVGLMKKEFLDTERDEVRAQLFGGLMEMLALSTQQMRAGAQPMVSNGRVIINPLTGEVADDHSARIRALEAGLKVHERISKLLGLDAAIKTEVIITDEARQAAQEAAAAAVTRLHAIEG